MQSCQVEPQSEPAYIMVDSVSVLKPSGNGYYTHDIRDLWSYLNDTNLGIYPHPTHITCIPEPETNRLTLLAGIRENGIASEVSLYPFLDAYEKEMELKAGNTYMVNPVFTYRKDVVIRFDDAFEDNNHGWKFDADNHPETGLTLSSIEPKSGQSSAYVKIPDSLASVELATSQAYFDVPTDGSAVYFEMDYKGDARLFVGLMGYENANASGTPLVSYYLGLVPRDQWTKIYVNLTSELFNSGLPAYRILMRLEHQETGVTEGIFLDNLKLLHF